MGRARRATRGGIFLKLSLPGIVLALALLAACSGSTTTGTFTGTEVAGTSTTPTAGTETPDASTPISNGNGTPGSGGGGVEGVAEFCTKPASVGPQLPASVPGYPNTQLHISQSQGGFGLFGICTSDSVSVVAQYYADQLTSKGWTNVEVNSIEDVQQVFADQGDNLHLSITVQPDPLESGVTEIIIQTVGS